MLSYFSLIFANFDEKKSKKISNYLNIEYKVMEKIENKILSGKKLFYSLIDPKHTLKCL